jgi:hypothetical protein
MTTKSTSRTRRKRLNSRQIAAILAGLRLLQCEIDNPDDGGWFGQDLQNIYTNCDEFDGLSSSEIDSLCEGLNFGDYD